MKLLCSLILIFITSFNVQAQAINGEFKPADTISQVKEGDLFEATLRFWPIENADMGQFKKLEKQVLFNAYYMAQILSLAPSDNNADVVELRALFIVKSSKVQPVFNFKYNENVIQLSAGALKIDELKNKSDNFFILDQSVNTSKLWMIVAVIILLLVVVAVIKRQSIKTFILKLRPDQLKKARRHYDELFRSADKRSDFEHLYKEKEKWMPLLTIKAPAHLEFLKTLNQHQFKKDWHNEEYAEVRASFDIIRRSFEQ